MRFACNPYSKHFSMLILSAWDVMNESVNMEMVEFTFQKVVVKQC